jgi:cell division protein ZapA
LLKLIGRNLSCPDQMSRVSVTINNRQFRIECEDGHEGYLMDLAREVDNRISGLRSKSGEISDNGLMVMLAITVADELSQAGQCIRRLEEELIAISDRHRAAQAAIAAALSTAAERVENVTKAIDASRSRSARKFGP